jgi:hypothetical protein
MNQKIRITAIFMALAIFGFCALIAPVCANIETTDTADPANTSEVNASNESDPTVEAINETSAHTDVVTTSTDADPEATDTEAEDSPGFGIFGVMISIALLFLLIRKKA